MLRVAMRGEIAWGVAACHASGARQIHASEWNRWAATAADVTRRRPEVCSFADLDLGEWMTAWGRVFHAGHDRMASAASPSHPVMPGRSDEHTSELQSHLNLVCRLLLEK